MQVILILFSNFLFLVRLEMSIGYSVSVSVYSMSYYSCIGTLKER